GAGSSTVCSAGRAFVGVVDVWMALGLDAEHVAGPADQAFELDRRVFDLELVRQHLADLGQDVLRLYHALVIDEQVGAHRSTLCAQRPDVQVVQVTDAGDAFHGVHHGIRPQV